MPRLNEWLKAFLKEEPKFIERNDVKKQAKRGGHSYLNLDLPSTHTPVAGLLLYREYLPGGECYK